MKTSKAPSSTTTTRFIEEFGHDLTQAEIRDTRLFQLEGTFLDELEANDNGVYLFYTFRSNDDPTFKLTLMKEAPVFVADRDMDFEFESAAYAIGYDLDNPDDMTEALSRFRRAQLIDADFVPAQDSNATTPTYFDDV